MAVSSNAFALIGYVAAGVSAVALVATSLVKGVHALVTRHDDQLSDQTFINELRAAHVVTRLNQVEKDVHGLRRTVESLAQSVGDTGGETLASMLRALLEQRR